MKERTVELSKELSRKIKWEAKKRGLSVQEFVSLIIEFYKQAYFVARFIEELEELCLKYRRKEIVGLSKELSGKIKKKAEKKRLSEQRFVCLMEIYKQTYVIVSFIEELEKLCLKYRVKILGLGEDFKKK